MPRRRPRPAGPAGPHLELGDDGGPSVLGAALQRLLLVAALHVLKQVVDEVQPGTKTNAIVTTTASGTAAGLRGEQTHRLSLSRFRTSSLKVSLFFCSMPLTSYTTWNTPAGGSRGRARLPTARRRTDACGKPAHLSGVMFDSKVMHGDARLHVEGVLLQRQRAATA